MANPVLSPCLRLVSLLLLAFGSLVFGAVEAKGADVDLPEDCPGLGVALVEHSCFHSTYGPFATRRATPGLESSSSTQNLNDVHTEYRVGLAGSESHVTYSPKRTGAFSVFLGSDVPLRVMRRGEAEPELLTFDEGTGCDALPVSHVFELGEFEYQLVFGPTSTQDVVVVIEYVDDFLIANGRDADGDGYGSRMDSIRSVCVPPEGYVQNTSDCDDANPAVNPGAVEICGDEVDANCNGLPDDVGLACSVGEGACRRTGEFACDGGGTVCSATPGESSAEECNGVDDDCNGRIDDAGNLCPDADRPTCVRDELGAFCGCLLDLDCGPTDSGRICSVEDRRCVSGCAAIPGRNGCPEGYECDVALGEHGECVEVPDPGVPPEAGAGGKGASGGSPSAGGAGSAGSAGGPGGTGPSQGGTENGSAGEPGEWSDHGGRPAEPPPVRIVETRGCGCRVAPPPSSPGWRSALIGLVAALLLRRRQRGFSTASRAAALFAVLLSVGCGGQSIETTEGDDAGHSGDHHHDHPHAGTTSIPAGAGGTGTGGAPVMPRGGSGTEGGSGGVATGGTGGAPCVPELAEKPVEHACSHMRLGPFVAVAALSPQRGAAADVSMVQTAFEVDVIDAGARLSYVATRDGVHVIFTNEAVALSVRGQSSAFLATTDFPVSDCEAIVAGVSVSLRVGEAYTFEIGEGAPRAFDVFVEHLGTFGDEAWARSCDR